MSLDCADYLDPLLKMRTPELDAVLQQIVNGRLGISPKISAALQAEAWRFWKESNDERHMQMHTGGAFDVGRFNDAFESPECPECPYIHMCLDAHSTLVGTCKWLGFSQLISPSGTSICG
jgi:hypothetical protein